MTSDALTQTPIARTGMRIRTSPAEVFEAFVDPAITSRFWFSGGSARLRRWRRARRRRPSSAD